MHNKILIVIGIIITFFLITAVGTESENEILLQGEAPEADEIKMTVMTDERAAREKYYNEKDFPLIVCYDWYELEKGDLDWWDKEDYYPKIKFDNKIVFAANFMNSLTEEKKKEVKEKLDIGRDCVWFQEKNSEEKTAQTSVGKWPGRMFDYYFPLSEDSEIEIKIEIWSKKENKLKGTASQTLTFHKNLVTTQPAAVGVNEDTKKVEIELNGLKEILEKEDAEVESVDVRKCTPEPVAACTSQPAQVNTEEEEVTAAQAVDPATAQAVVEDGAGVNAEPAIKAKKKKTGEPVLIYAVSTTLENRPTKKEAITVTVTDKGGNEKDLFFEEDFPINVCYDFSGIEQTWWGKNFAYPKITVGGKTFLAGHMRYKHEKDWREKIKNLEQSERKDCVSIPFAGEDADETIESETGLLKWKTRTKARAFETGKDYKITVELKQAFSPDRTSDAVVLATGEKTIRFGEIIVPSENILKYLAKINRQIPYDIYPELFE
ncbi:MAG: hypothetical protein JW772_02690 [Candidatus Diapherotrites archaeon]|nr:hypothetical protein [Candidatus Diapherotrites archaeon]